MLLVVSGNNYCTRFSSEPLSLPVSNLSNKFLKKTLWFSETPLTSRGYKKQSHPDSYTGKLYDKRCYQALLNNRRPAKHKCAAMFTALDEYNVNCCVSDSSKSDYSEDGNIEKKESHHYHLGVFTRKEIRSKISNKMLRWNVLL